MFADVISQANTTLPQYGLAGLVIAALVVALIVLYKDGKNKDKLLQSLQDARLQDARETRDKLTESMQQQSFLTQKIYDIIIANNRQP